MNAGEAPRIKYRYQTEIQQMMFVFGEVPDPLPETTLLVEDIVRSHCIELKRSSRYLTHEDLIFTIRKDRAKVNRLRNFLSWKDVRRKAKENAGAVDPTEELLEDVEEAERAQKSRRRPIKLSWDLLRSFQEEDEDSEEEAYLESLQRLQQADEITRKMSRDEYVHYSECRQASFTYRKAKKFREWACMAQYMDTKPNDDIVDILGFLAFEILGTLTTTALDARTQMPPAVPGLFGTEQQAPLQPEDIAEAYRRLKLRKQM